MEQHIFSSRLAISFSCVGHTYSHLFTPIFFTLVPLALEAHLGLSHGETVSLIVVGNALFGFAAPLAGWLADRWSSVGMMALFYLGTGAGMIMVGFADTPFGIAFGLGVTGLFASIYHPVGVAWLVKVAHNPGTALGINGSFGGMGAALGTVITGALITAFGWRFAYILPGATVLATGAIFVVCILRGWISDTDTSHRRPAPPASRADTIRVVAVLAFVMLCGGMIFHATGPALPKAFALDFSTGGEGVMTVAYLVGLAYAAGGLMQIIGGKLADVLPARRVYLFAFVLQVPVLLSAGQLGGGSLVAFAILMVCLNFGGVPAENILIARYTPMHRRGLVFGLKFVLALGIASMGVMLEGFLFDISGGFTAVFRVLAGLALMGACAILMLPAERKASALVEAAE